MNKFKKVLLVAERGLIKSISNVNGRLYRNLYVKYLKKVGVNINGLPNYINSTVYFDGYDYSLITLNNNITISKEVMFLTHDGSMHTVKTNLAIKNKSKVDDISGGLIIVKGISVGENTFIGARASILPGTTIGKNVIIGACSVVKGNIPDNSIVAGNPCKIIGNTSDWLDKKLNGGDYVIREY